MYKLATKLENRTHYLLRVLIKELNFEIELDIIIMKIFNNNGEIESSKFILEYFTIDNKYYKIFDDDYKYTVQDIWNHNNLTNHEIKIIERELNNFRIKDFLELIDEDKDLNVVRF